LFLKPQITELAPTLNFSLVYYEYYPYRTHKLAEN